MTNSKKLNNSSEIGIEHKYINADKSIKDIKEVFCKPCKERGDDYHGISCRACRIEDCIDIIDAESADDINPVVHCKDCKYYANTGIGPYCFNDFWGIASVAYPLKNDFCSHGEKMDGDEHEHE